MTRKEVSLSIIHKLQSEGFAAYWAGGCVRDQLLGIEALDFDIATNAPPEKVQSLFPRTISVGAKFGVICVIAAPDIQIEVATFRKEGTYSDGRHPDQVTFATAREDAQRRDFTINGMFFDPPRDELFDYVGGRKDLQQKLIRAIGRPKDRFAEDKLRMLRAVRFAARFDFTIEEKTFDAITASAAEILTISAERIGEEMCKIMTGPRAGNALVLLQQSGLLQAILPEVSAMIGVRQPPDFHPEGDVFTHTKLLLDQLKEPSDVLAFGALLHDVGKPSTFEQTDRIRFNRHEYVGAQMAEDICRRLKFSNEKTKQIVACVKNHMQFKDVKNMRESTLRRFLGRDTFETELELHRIDCLASHKRMEMYEYCKAKIAAYAQQQTSLKPAPLITGEDLISRGLKPGPRFSKILDFLYAGQLENKFGDKDSAQEFLDNYLRDRAE